MIHKLVPPDRDFIIRIHENVSRQQPDRVLHPFAPDFPNANPLGIQSLPQVQHLQQPNRRGLLAGLHHQAPDAGPVKGRFRRLFRRCPGHQPPGSLQLGRKRVSLLRAFPGRFPGPAPLLLQPVHPDPVTRKGGLKLPFLFRALLIPRIVQIVRLLFLMALSYHTSRAFAIPALVIPAEIEYNPFWSRGRPGPEEERP